MSGGISARADKLDVRSCDGEWVSRSVPPGNRHGKEEPGPLGGELTGIDWDGLFRRFDNGRGTGSLFFNGGSASDKSPGMGGDNVWRSWVEIAVTAFGGDPCRIRGRCHTALALCASTIVAARSCGSGLRVSDETGTWLFLWGDQEREPETHLQRTSR